ncbi:hypothetical protein Vretimale_3333, partial [Volvox reticuliferus]
SSSPPSLPDHASTSRARKQGWTEQHISYMCQALAQAHEAWACREVPVGCVVVRDGEVIGRGHNLTNKTRNVSFILLRSSKRFGIPSMTCVVSGFSPGNPSCRDNCHRPNACC